MEPEIERTGDRVVNTCGEQAVFWSPRTVE